MHCIAYDDEIVSDDVDDIACCVHCIHCLLLFLELYDFLTLLPLWLLVRHCSRLGEESDGDDDARVDVDAEE